VDESVQGINWGVGHQAQVINMSYVGSYDSGEAVAVANAWIHDIVLVAGLGNAGSSVTRYPAGYDHVIGVAGLAPNGTFASFNPCGAGTGSDYGAAVDFVAPFSTFTTIGGNAHTTVCGNSVATPFVAGIAALMRAYDPSMSNQRVFDLLVATAKDRGPAGWDQQYGYGIPDAYQAFRQFALYGSIDGPGVIETPGTYTWESLPVNGNGTYSYIWYYRPQGVSTWTQVGTGKRYTRSVTSERPSHFQMMVTVSSGGRQWSTLQSTSITFTTTGVCTGRIC
jgi:subtilisin family serine protease